MLTVIGYGGTRAFRVLWMLEELGLSYHHDRVMPFTEAARARAPGGRVPALELDDGQVLLDSTAILAYLADRHDALTCRPGTVDRARQDAWVGRILDALDAPLMTWALILQGIGAPPDPAVRDNARRAVAAGLADMDAALGDQAEGPWLMGRRFTFADIVLGHCLHWAERSEHPVDGHPHLAAYLRAVQRRAAYVAADSA